MKTLPSTKAKVSPMKKLGRRRRPFVWLTKKQEDQVKKAYRKSQPEKPKKVLSVVLTVYQRQNPDDLNSEFIKINSWNIPSLAIAKRQISDHLKSKDKKHVALTMTWPYVVRKNGVQRVLETTNDIYKFHVIEEAPDYLNTGIDHKK
jgi:hypothetical protein